MVDVGYFIDGKCGVIKNVEANEHDRGMDSIWFKNSNGELCRLKFSDIIYIIPHEEECKEHTEEADKPLTNAEKFKEVFGYEPNMGLSMCDLASCDNYRCNNCPYEEHCNWWNEKYTGEFHIDEN